MFWKGRGGGRNTQKDAPGSFVYGDWRRQGGRVREGSGQWRVKCNLLL